MFELPMFPLGSVTVPGSGLPLRVFEHRYQELVLQCLTSDGRFGTVLIERGSEVGGGDVRCSVGALLSIVQAEPSPSGQWAVFAVATERLRVVEWRPDDPFPTAVVELHPDAPPDARTDDALLEAHRAVSAWLERAAALGLAVPLFEPGPTDDPTRASFRLVATSPLGPLDRQALLEADGPTRRCEELVRSMEGQIELLEARFGSTPD